MGIPPINGTLGGVLFSEDINLGELGTAVRGVGLFTTKAGSERVLIAARCLDRHFVEPLAGGMRGLSRNCNTKHEKFFDFSTLSVGSAG